MKLLSLTVLVLFSFCNVFAADTIYLGRSSNELEKENKRLTPIAKYLSSRLSDAGISSVKVKLDLQNSVGSLIQLIDENKMHLILESPYGISQYYKAGKASPMLIVSRKSKITQHTVFFSRNDADINSPNDLVGKVIAFEDRNSTTGFVLPAKYLTSLGYTLNEIKQGEAPQPGVINYVFAESEFNITSWVNLKRVSAGALNINDWENDKYNPPNLKEQSHIFEKTPEIITMFLSAGHTLNQKQKELIKSVLLDMHNNPEGKKSLENYKIDRFLELPDNWKQYNKLFL